RGRNLNEFDRPGSTPVVVISETTGRLLWPDQDPLHKRLTYYGNKVPFEVVGIVADSVVQQIGEDPQPVIYYSMRQRYSPAATIRIYGVMAHSVTQRTSEIGIRMSLGASRLQILKLILGRGMLITLVGAVIGIIGFLFLSPVMAQLLFSVNARDPLTVAAVTA